MKKMLGLGLLMVLLSTTAMAANVEVKMRLKVIDTVQVFADKVLDFGTFIKNNNQGALTARSYIRIENIDEKEKGRLLATIVKNTKLTNEKGDIAIAELKLDKFNEYNVTEQGIEDLNLTSTILNPEKLATGTYNGSATVTVVYN